MILIAGGICGPTECCPKDVLVHCHSSYFPLGGSTHASGAPYIDLRDPVLCDENSVTYAPIVERFHIGDYSLVRQLVFCHCVQRKTLNVDS